MYSKALQAQKRKLGLKVLKPGDLCYRDGSTKMPTVPPHLRGIFLEEIKENSARLLLKFSVIFCAFEDCF